MFLKKYKFYIILFVLVFANLFLFSSTSPLHSLMNLQYDQLLYNLIGKGMKYGKVPYKDLIDHKGIYLFSVYALANIICEYKHIGLFIITVIYNFAEAIFIYKISVLLLTCFSKNSISVNSNKNFSSAVLNDNAIYHISILISFIIICLANTYFFSVGGLECETLVIPYITASLYMFLKFILSGDSKHSYKDIFIYGVFVGIILFTKANCALFFGAIAAYILIYLLIKKQYINLFFNILYGILGMIIAILPAVVYCICTKSFCEMLYQTFVVNFKYISVGFMQNNSLVESFFVTFNEFKNVTALSIISIFPLNYFIKSRKISLFYIISLLLSLYATYMSLRPYTHYLLLVIIYVLPNLLFILLCFYKIFYYSKFIKISYYAFFIVLFIMSYSLNLEIALANGFIQQSTTNAVKKILVKDKEANKKDIYVVGFSMFIYEGLDIIPTERYFATPAIFRKNYSLPYDEILKVINSGKYKYVIISWNTNMSSDKEFQNEVEEDLSKQYVVLATFKQFAQNIIMYKRVN